MSNEIPRRAYINKLTPAEHAIYDAIAAVEAAGADVRLTDAVNLLQAARHSVADYVDGVESRRSVLEGAAGEGLSDDSIREWWRSVQGQCAELTGPLIRFADRVWREAQSEKAGR